MFKAILFDIDGVLIKHHPYFSDRYARDHFIPLEIIKPFFQEVYPQCLTGKLDLKEAIQPYLANWQWQGTVDELLHYWFSGCESEIDYGMLNFLREIREITPCYFATNQEKYRVHYLLETLHLGREVRKAFISSEMGMTKSDPQFFLTILTELNVLAHEVAYLDDDPINVATAHTLGIQAELFTTLPAARELVVRQRLQPVH